MLDLRNDVLSIPSPEVIRELSAHRIIECGAGKGLWMNILKQFGIDIIGIDPNPSGTVEQGSHLDLAQYRDRLLLIVWPPDGTQVSKWIDVWGGEYMAVCGCFARFNCPDFETTFETKIPAGHKGGSLFKFGTVY